MCVQYSSTKFAKFIRIAQWNANGILQYKNKVEIFLHHNLINILLVSETHFIERSYFHAPHYTTYVTNYPDNTAHAGTAILIKNTINHYEMSKYEENFLLPVLPQ
ncbi:hypothetical protein ILUMI_21007 [Ignelater luminosus]|uniref:Uncharacterized protein n=1 Tax=Ignelater luminosus TaxID=2038154 RepID=A0A8K0G1T7_IGNLU|nr:hypothetical protein ILUMI_21007 [Ignelater luminosus]